jgi:acyl-CoA synthetase (AMP-forming)/AMP-acid ligase II/acyl carrier protein
MDPTSPPNASPSPGEPSCIQDLLEAAVELEPKKVAFTFLLDGESKERTLTYEELRARVEAIAARLRRSTEPGSTALLLFPPDLEYVTTFLGCLYAGLLPVPAYPPDPGRISRTLPRLQAIIKDANVATVLTTTEIAPMAEALFALAPELAAKQWITTDDAVLPPGVVKAPVRAAPDDIAFLQYTSGSTGNPRGVMLRHRNLLENVARITEAFEITERSVGMSWLPPYHDMGLIGCILAPLYRRCPVVLMSPVDFLRRPARWLKAISRYRATISGGPNFAYDLCVRKIAESERRGLDLSSWSLAFSGAEPVRSETFARFVDRFCENGFRRKSLLSCYGLAEATLLVTATPTETEPHRLEVDADTLQLGRVVAPEPGAPMRELMSCGGVVPGHDLLVVDPDRQTAVDDGHVGEIWLRGPSVAGGYWRQPEATAESFGARLRPGERPYLRTGDLGFLTDGQLYVTGRAKDLVIIRGRNHYPQDIERTVEECHPSLRRGCCAVFSVELRSEEHVVVAVEVERRYHERRASGPETPENAERRSGDRRGYDPASPDHVSKMGPGLAPTANLALEPDAVCEVIREAVLAEYALHVLEVVLLKPGGLPKTSSGKVQRRETRRQFLASELEVVATNRMRAYEETKSTSFEASHLATMVVGLSDQEQVRWVESFVRDSVARTLKTDPANIDFDRSAIQLGLDSMLALDLVHRVEKRLGVHFPLSELLRETTLREIAAQIRSVLVTEEEAMSSVASTLTCPLSYEQQGAWVLHHLRPEGASQASMGCVLRLQPPIVVDLLVQAIRKVVTRHRILRACYPLESGEVRQTFVEPDAVIEVSELREGGLDERVRAFFARELDPIEGPLFRVLLLTAVTDGGASHLLLHAHALVADTMTTALVLMEIGQSYGALLAGGKVSLGPVGADYADYVVWQRTRVGTAALRAAVRSERERLEPVLNQSEWLAERGRFIPAQGGRRERLSPELSGRIRDVASQERVTPYMVMLAVYSALLAMSRLPQIGVACAVTARNRADFERMAGNFSNTVVLPFDLSPSGLSFREHLHQTRRLLVDVLEHQDVPWGALIRGLGVRRQLDVPPLAWASFTFERVAAGRERLPTLAALGVPGVRLPLGPIVAETAECPYARGAYPVACHVVDAGKSFYLQFDARTSWWHSDEERGAASLYQELLSAVIASPDAPMDVDTSWRRTLGSATPSRPIPRVPRPAPHALTEFLSKQWVAVLSVREVSAHQDFFADLAGSSLQAVVLALELCDLLDLQPRPELIFECPTLSRLADRLIALSGAEELTRRVRVLERLAGMSEEQAARLLSGEGE